MEKLLEIATPYGVKGINLGGCISGQAKGYKGAMRRSAHAHCYPSYKAIVLGQKVTVPLDWYGWICIKSSKIEKLLKKDGKPNELFWHEVSHIYRRSRTQQECDNGRGKW
jgi:hypothetical protein